MPAAGTPGTTDPATISKDIAGAIDTKAYTVTSISSDALMDFTPDVPPDPSLTGKSAYSLTMEEYYDAVNMQTQCQFWVYDNITQTLVVTDQAVFPLVTSETTDAATAEDAEVVIPATVQYVLSLIPTYTITVNADLNGTVTADNEALPLNSNDRTVAWGAKKAYQAHGSYNGFSLTAKAGLNYYFQGWRINGKQALNTSNPLQLVLNPLNYPGRVTKADPWATKVAIQVEAVFTNDISQAADRSLITNGTSTVAGNLGWPWFAELSYNPIYPLTLSGSNAYFNQLMPEAALLSVGVIPITKKWGNVGFGLNFSYTGGKSTLSDGITSQFNMLRLGVHAFYRTKPFWGHVEPWVKLGFGPALFSKPVTSTNEDKDIQMTYGDLATWALYLDIGLGMDYTIGQNLYISVGAKLDVLMFNNVQLTLLAPQIGIGVQL
jgi:hypothetical protein